MLKRIAGVWNRFFDWLAKHDYEKTNEDGPW
jgi:hypothetical protein